MGASKTYQFSEREIQFARYARAISHPARIRILQLMCTNDYLRNVDLIHELQLVKSSVSSHLKKMEEAGIIHIDFFPNCYHVRLNKDRWHDFQEAMELSPY